MWLFDRSRKLDNVVRQKWGDQPWQGIAVEAGGKWEKNADLVCCKRIQSAAKNVSAPLLIVLDHSYGFTFHDKVYHDTLQIITACPVNSDGMSLFTEDLVGRLLYDSRLFQPSLSERNYRNFDEALSWKNWDHKSIRAWRINFRK